MTEYARPRQIREWWIEYKVAAQFSKTWDDVEELLALIQQKRGFSPMSDREWVVWASGGIGSAPYWMQQVDVPRWFKFDELAIGTDESIWNTIATLTERNEKRRRRYEEMILQLEKNHKARFPNRKPAKVARQSVTVDRDRSWIPVDPNGKNRKREQYVHRCRVSVARAKTQAKREHWARELARAEGDLLAV